MNGLRTAAVSLALSLPAVAHPTLEHYGSAGCGIGAYTPTFHTDGSFPVVGNAGFRLVSRNLRGGAAGITWLSPGKADLPLPWPGVTLLVDLTRGFGLVCRAGGTPGAAGTGESTLSLPIPNLGTLAGGSLHLQSFFVDRAAPLSLVCTQGLRLQVRPGIPPIITILHDRPAYQAFFRGVSESRAECLGRAIWRANAQPGFEFLRVRHHSCGGQDHWLLVVRDLVLAMEFALIPGGSFRMGDINDRGFDAEKPVHWVRVKPFLLALREVDRRRFLQVMGKAPWQGMPCVAGAATSDRCAANYIDWQDAAHFCSRLGWRLPSDAEWEYACRAGTESVYSNGRNDAVGLDRYARYCIGYTSSLAHPDVSGKRLPNAFGLFDMHGNVWEWCGDRWHPGGYRGAPVDGSARSTGSLADRVLRGGGWSDTEVCCRSAYRSRLDPTVRSPSGGFRPACSLR